MQKRARAELRSELSEAKLGDARRSQRLGVIVERAAARPGASFPQMAEDESELEALYRFMNNEHVSPEAILEPHIEASIQRATREPQDVLLIHDTTFATYEGERKGLGRLHRHDRGYWAHVSLAVSFNRLPLGVVGLKYGTRHGPSKWKGNRRISAVRDESPAESRRWLDLVSETAARFGERRPIHVMDREADWSELFNHLVKLDQRFVIRLAHDRMLDNGVRISEQWSGVTITARREVPLTRRTSEIGPRRNHRVRTARVAKLTIRAMTVQLRNRGRTMQANVVNVSEPGRAADGERVDWNLITTESIATKDDLLRIVDAYRARWTIEELFKALKTGCAIEKRQLGSYRALVNALAIFLPVAWALLLMRDVARSSPTAPASLVLDANYLAVLRRIARRPLRRHPSASDVTYAIAALGGHLKRNGEPGWLTLARGYEDLVRGVVIANALSM